MTGVSRNFSTSAKATISSNLRRISARVMPRIAPFRIDVLAAGQFGVKAGADLEQAGDAAADQRRGPRVGSVMRLEDLQQRALAGAVAADDAEHLAALDLEADILERPELLDRRRPARSAGRAAMSAALRRKVARSRRDDIAQRRVASRARPPGGRSGSSWRASRR